MKKTLFLLCLFALICQWSNGEIVNGINYRISSSNTASVIANQTSPYTGHVVIPDSVSINNVSYRVNAIQSQAFENCSTLLSITLPESLDSIHHYAFKNCTGLTSLTIPEHIKHFGWDVFRYCSGITKVYYNAINAETNKSYYSIKDDQRNIFNGCMALDSVILGANVTTIPDLLFYNNTNLTTLITNDKLRSVGYLSFSRCDLSSVNLPLSCKYINTEAFSRNTYLQTVNLPGVKSIGDYAFYCDMNISTLNLGDSLQEIGECAFNECRNLTNLYLSANLTLIKSAAFYNAYGIRSITCLAPIPPTVVNSAATFYSINNVIPLYVCTPSLYALSDSWNSFKNMQLSNLCPTSDLSTVNQEDRDQSFCYVQNKCLFLMPLSEANDDDELIVYTVSGALIYCTNVHSVESFHLDMNDWVNGYYIVTYKNKKQKIWLS